MYGELENCRTSIISLKSDYFKGYHFLLKLTLPIAPIVYSYESRTGYIKDAQKFNAWIIRPTERLYLDIVLNNPKNKLSFSKVFKNCLSLVKQGSEGVFLWWVVLNFLQIYRKTFFGYILPENEKIIYTVSKSRNIAVFVFWNIILFG